MLKHKGLLLVSATENLLHTHVHLPFDSTALSRLNLEQLECTPSATPVAVSTALAQ